MKLAAAAMLCAVAELAIGGPAWTADFEDVDPTWIAANPQEFVGVPVSLVVKLTKIDNGSEPWEEQAHLNAGSKIKFTAAPLKGIKCYADRTPANLDALTGLKKGRNLILTGSLKRYQSKVKQTYDRKAKGRGQWNIVKRDFKGGIHYAFVVETIAQ